MCIRDREKGPTISEKEGQGFLDHYRHLVEQVEVVAISGSLPAGLPVDYYASPVSYTHLFRPQKRWRFYIKRT